MKLYWERNVFSPGAWKHWHLWFVLRNLCLKQVECSPQGGLTDPGEIRSEWSPLELLIPET